MRRRTTCLATLVALALGAPAHATTVGGHSQTFTASMALAAGRVFIPSASEDDPGDWIGGPVTADLDVQTLTPSVDNPPFPLASGDPSTVFGGPPVIATADGRAAAAWISGRTAVTTDELLSSALLGRSGQPLAPSAPITADGVVERLDTAVDEAGDRAVAWADSGGLQVASVSASGVTLATTQLAVAPPRVYGVAVVSDDAGGWWTVWVSGTQIAAARTAANGAVITRVALGSSALADGRAQESPGGDLSRPWRLVPDGAGGVWLGLARQVLHLGPVGGRSVVAGSPRRLVLAAGDRVSVVARDLAGARVLVRRLGGRPRPAIHLRGVLVDVAYDHALQTIDVLTLRAHRRVRLTRLSPAGAISATRLLPDCHGLHTGQVLADSGLVAVACAQADNLQESVMSGGDSLDGHVDEYELLRHDRVVSGTEITEGEYDY